MLNPYFKAIIGLELWPDLELGLMEGLGMRVGLRLGLVLTWA